jgi:hypothetical protein
VVPPLIVTLLLDDAAQARFDRLRAAHFPSARNHLAAHVTLFHALPGELLTEVRDACGRRPTGRPSRWPSPACASSAAGWRWTWPPRS